MIQLLHDVLGPSDEKSKGNHAFHCPFCNHRKRKLEVQPDLGAWACWVCHTSGKTIKSLLKKLNVSDAIMQRYNVLVPHHKFYIEYSSYVKSIDLPKTFRPLWKKSNSPYWNKAYKYAINVRGLTAMDLMKYNVGYSEDGKHSGMLIFPNYNSEGKLNFYTTRSYIGEKKFINEKIDRNVVGFEMQLSTGLPLILTEGPIDAMTVRVNASPLYGTQFSKALKAYILDNDISDVYMCLDPDAVKYQIDFLKYLNIFGVNAYNVKIPNNEDINSLGYENSWELINSTKPITVGELFDLEIKMKL
jgi:hypothetical protein